MMVRCRILAETFVMYQGSSDQTSGSQAHIVVPLARLLVVGKVVIEPHEPNIASHRGIASMKIAWQNDT